MSVTRQNAVLLSIWRTWISSFTLQRRSLNRQNWLRGSDFLLAVVANYNIHQGVNTLAIVIDRKVNGIHKELKKMQKCVYAVNIDFTTASAFRSLLLDIVQITKVCFWPWYKKNWGPVSSTKIILSSSRVKKLLYFFCLLIWSRCLVQSWGLIILLPPSLAPQRAVRWEDPRNEVADWLERHG